MKGQHLLVKVVMTWQQSTLRLFWPVSTRRKSSFEQNFNSMSKTKHLTKPSLVSKLAGTLNPDFSARSLDAVTFAKRLVRTSKMNLFLIAIVYLRALWFV